MYRTRAAVWKLWIGRRVLSIGKRDPRRAGAPRLHAGRTREREDLAPPPEYSAAAHRDAVIVCARCLAALEGLDLSLQDVPRRRGLTG